jgi:hypothetical protein
MNLTEVFSHANFSQELDAQAIELAYKDLDVVVMIFLFSNQKTGLTNLDQIYLNG